MGFGICKHQEKEVKAEMTKTYYKNAMDEYDKISELADRELLEKIYSKLINVEFMLNLMRL